MSEHNNNNVKHYTNLIIMAYASAGLIYGHHYITGQNYDFMLLSIIYLMIGLLYTVDVFNIISDMFILLAIVYVVMSCTYLKHYIHHGKYDYMIFVVGYIIGSFVEYMMATHKGSRTLETSEKIRLSVLFLIPCMYAKHLWFKQEYDYILFAGLYLSYALSIYASHEHYNMRFLNDL